MLQPRSVCWCGGLGVVLAVTFVMTSTERVLEACGTGHGKVINEALALEDEDGTRYPSGCTWTDKSSVVRGCESQAPCLWQCCPDGHQINATTSTCVPSDDARWPETPFNLSSFHFLVGNPCPGGWYGIPEDEISKVRDDGGLLEVGVKEVYRAGEFCMGETLEGQTLALVCDPRNATNSTEEDERDPVTFVIYNVVRVITLPFLIATAVVYVIIPELRNLHGKCLVSHVSSLAIAYFFLTILSAASTSLSKGMCVTSAFIVYFFLLSSFFWLNVMCFDIFWTFSGHRRGGYQDQFQQMTFLFYSLYAWGAAVVMLCVSIIMDFSPLVPDTYMKPGIGVKKCWFKDKPTVLAYFSGPVIVLLLINIVFFAITAVHILRTRRLTKLLTAAGNQRTDKNDERRFVLYLKLFLVMGITWGFEFIAWAVGGPDYIWWLPDVLNILQGVIIFIMFVMKKRVRKLLKQRFNYQHKKPPSTVVTYVNRSGSGSSEEAS